MSYVITADGDILWETIRDEEDSVNRVEEYDDEDEEDEDFNCWIKTGSVYTASKGSTIEGKLENGFYSIASSQNQILLRKYRINTDSLYMLPDETNNKVVEEISKFWDKSKLYAEHNVIHKRGILLAGHPGTGKSSLINIIAKQVVKNNGVVFYVDSVNELHLFLTMVHSQLRAIEPNRPIIVIIEDIDKITNNGGESIISNFLDGPDQIDHCVVLATTNRLHELNDLMLRPSRFDWIIEIEKPNLKVRRYFFEQKNITGSELEEWAEKTNDLSLADLKEVFIGVKLLGYSMDEILSKLKGQKDMVQNTTHQGKRTKVGF